MHLQECAERGELLFARRVVGKKAARLASGPGGRHSTQPLLSRERVRETLVMMSLCFEVRSEALSSHSLAANISVHCVASPPLANKRWGGWVS